MRAAPKKRNSEISPPGPPHHPHATPAPASSGLSSPLLLATLTIRGEETNRGFDGGKERREDLALRRDIARAAPKELKYQLVPRRSNEIMTERYGDHDYWNERYELSDSPFDWMCSYDDLAPTLRALLPRADDGASPSILVVGCGDAPFSADLYLDGYRNTLNVDYSDVVIRKQKGRFPWLEGRFKVMDCLNMNEIEDNTFGKGRLGFLLQSQLTQDEKLNVHFYRCGH